MKVGRHEFQINSTRIEALGWFLASVFLLIYGLSVSGNWLNFVFGALFYVVAKKGINTALDAY